MIRHQNANAMVLASALEYYQGVNARGGEKKLFSGTATKSGKIFCELSMQINPV
jgi:hypothetical protein